MKEIDVEAKSGGKVVATGKAKQYESLAEAIKDQGGETKVLSLINAQLKTNVMNTLRRPKSEVAAMASLLAKAKKENPALYQKALENMKKLGIPIEGM